MKKITYPKKVIDEIYSRVVKKRTHLLWKGSCNNPSGSFSFVLDGKQYTARKVLWEQKNKEQYGRDKMLVRTCKEECCITPEHFKLMTKSDHQGAAGRKPLKVSEVFEAIDKRIEKKDGHFIWKGAVKKEGMFFSVMIKGKAFTPVKFLYEQQTKTKYGKDKLLKRSCSEIYCVNPDHFKLITKKELLKGRVLGRTGNDHPFSQLTDAKVKKIKTRLAKGEDLNIIADKFKVSRSCIRSIEIAKTWKHIKLDKVSENKIKKNIQKRKESLNTKTSKQMLKKKSVKNVNKKTEVQQEVQTEETPNYPFEIPEAKTVKKKSRFEKLKRFWKR